MAGYHFATISELHTAFRDGSLTVRELVLSFLARIAEIDKTENGLNSVLELNPDALFIADRLDKKIRSGEPLGALFGIPVLLKDNINTADRMHTSAGSLALQDHYASYDAFIVKRLREADAVILGKANMTEFANFITDGEMPSGYSSRGGQVINPHVRENTPSGSSSGSAVAVAAGLCTVSVGTETCGSIVSPAGQNGIVGLKPTLGLVSRNGIIPIAHTFDIAGPMARTVEDTAKLLNVLAGVDPEDASTHAQPKRMKYDYLLNADLKGTRIGIYRPQIPDELSLADDRKASFDQFCKSLSDAGAILTDDIKIDLEFNMWNMMRYEFKSDMNYYLSTLGGRAALKTLGDIIAYNEAHAETALKYGQSTFVNIENNTSGNMTEPEYLHELATRESVIRGFDQVFEQYDIDIILCRTFNNIIAPFTGFPSLILPIGQQQNRQPIDCYLMARRYDEVTLLNAAYAIERLVGYSGGLV